MYKVIIVDDEVWVLRGLESIIDWGQYGFKICAACRSAGSAVEAIKSFQPDIIFTDIRMPQMSGIELMEEECVKSLNPLIVIVSAHRDFDIAKEAIKKGVFDYLLKPLERDIVIEVAHRARLQLDRRYEEKTPAIDLEREEYDIQQVIRQMPPGGNCYICISEQKIENWQPWEENGTVAKVAAAPYPEAFLYTGVLPHTASFEERVGISILREDFLPFREMIREAICALEGGFIYSSRKNVAEIQLYIAENYQKKLTTKEIAGHFFLSEAYIYELFQKYVGNTVTGFIKGIRMNHAMRLLADPKLSIREISEAIGFEDAGYFGRVFKNYFGCSPDRFRS